MGEETNQAYLANELAEELQVCGHEINAMDLLDCMATLGLELLQDKEAAAAIAYYLSLSTEED